MTCPSCQSSIPEGSRFCPACGAPVPQPIAVGSYTEPVGESDNPKEPMRVGDTTVVVEGELVPVVDIELGARTSVYFEHHILLWKQPQVRLGFMGLQNAGKRFFAGLQIFISTAQGPGNIAMSREAPGQVVSLRLRPGEMVDVREHQFLMATNNVGYDFYWQTGLANVFFSRTGLFIDRFAATAEEGLLLLHGYGNVFQKTLQPGEKILVEPGGFLYKDSSVTMNTVKQSMKTGMMGGHNMYLAEMAGPGRVGIQSMYVHHGSE